MTNSVSQQIVYLNGSFLPMAESQISTQDRGFLFGDGVYEVIPVYQRNIFRFEEHLQRLKNSLQATSIVNPFSDDEWLEILENLVAKHPWNDQYLYLQVTRGVQMQRDHLPADCLTPTVYAYTNPLKPVAQNIIENGIKVVTLEDIRWLRCDIKAITLLPNVMMKLAAKAQGADDAILVSREGVVSEGTASNTFIVKDGTLITPPNSHSILPGITRMVIESIAEQQNMPIVEKQISLEELNSADEIWLSSSTKEALPVTQLDGKMVGDGKPGKVWLQMHKFFQEHKQQFIQQLNDAN
ncbi:cytochrome c550 [Thiomicrorhabdus immobilis]|uniref:D-alanine aminotransferase n=1 Tax=Thiomicrorhabdus immobilis TaxID=2791037 RepID=A0ABN6CV89_9GAMM|nr:D-amino-acid transaminase [Thiomicrorhabdus immobilis]BCN92870.1 cytochrome c550 [Thiomicrorhabdus immobilis]